MSLFARNRAEDGETGVAVRRGQVLQRGPGGLEQHLRIDSIEVARDRQLLADRRPADSQLLGDLPLSHPRGHHRPQDLILNRV